MTQVPSRPQAVNLVVLPRIQLLPWSARTLTTQTARVVLRALHELHELHEMREWHEWRECVCKRAGVRYRVLPLQN